MLMRIKNVKYLNEYKLQILFSNGKTKIIDLENWINEGGVYILPLKNIEYFKKVQIDKFNYSICWPNGADFSPDVLYEIGKNVPKRQPKSNAKLHGQNMIKKTTLKRQSTYAMTKKRPKKSKI